MNEKLLHILFLPAWYPYDEDPMSGLFVQNHARAVSKFQKITVVHAQAKKEQPDKFRLDVSETFILRKMSICAELATMILTKKKNNHSNIYLYRISLFHNQTLLFLDKH